jgi:hypothetical protein
MYKFRWKSYVLFIMLLLIIGGTASAQNYLNLTARWKQSFSYNGISNSTFCISERYFDRDTIINGKVYYLLFYTDECILSTRTFDSLGNPIVTRDTTNLTSFICFVREENKKIYLRDFVDNEELRYDFGVPDNSPIDSIVKLAGCSNSFVQILTHDTVCIGNEKRKSWQVSMSQFPLAQRIIEGVGPSSGFLAPICRNGCPECGYNLLSFTLNGDTLYKGNCTSTGLHEIVKAEVSIYPNPCIDYLNIQSDETIHRYSISNVNGVELANEQIEEKNFKIDNTSLNNGVYILKLYFDDAILVRKFLK